MCAKYISRHEKSPKKLIILYFGLFEGVYGRYMRGTCEDYSICMIPTMRAIPVISSIGILNGS